MAPKGRRKLTQRMLRILTCALALVACDTAWAATAGPGACAPLGPASGRVIDVRPEQAGRLPSIVRDAPAGATVRLRAGRYRVRGNALQLARPGVTLRSRSGDPRDVVIDGGYGANELLQVSAGGVTVAELTLTRARDHLVHAFPAEGRGSIERLRLHRVRLVDGGEQFVKANQNVSRTGRVVRSTVECSSFRMTTRGRRNIERAFGCYTGGIDAHGARRWRVRRNRFQGIYCDDGEVAEHAIHFWRRASRTLVENNLIVNCARGIGFGLTTDAIDGHGRGIIRRNVIVADIPQYDSGIGLAKATDVRVLHNTVAETDRARNAFTSIDIRFSGSSGLVANNLVEGIRFRDGGAAWLRGNIDSFPLSWLRAPARGDVHLRRGVNAINSGVMVARAGRDLDGTARPRGRPDVGADERGGRG
jgi:hypothetical protein